MKKLRKPAIVIILLLSIAVLYKYVLFDHEPFDNIKAADVENIYITRINDGWRVQIADIPQFLERLEDVELRRRTAEFSQEKVVSGVKVSIYYTDGNIQIISVDNYHIQIDGKLFEAEREDAYYFIEYANRLLFDDSQLEDHYDKTRYDKIIGIYLQGRSQRQVREWSKERLVDDGMITADWLKTLASSGWAPEQMYAITDEKRNEIITGIKESVMPGGAVRRLTYEQMASDVLEKYKKGEIIYDDVYSRPPEDFNFPEYIDWGRYSFQQNEMGYFFVTFPSVDDEDYFMSISVDDMMFNGVMRETPLIKYVGFYHR